MLIRKTKEVKICRERVRSTVGRSEMLQCLIRDLVGRTSSLLVIIEAEIMVGPAALK